jgi:hypothetical protein
MTASEFKELSNWQKIRTLSGVVPQTGSLETDVKILTDRLAICCLISRVEEGDATEEFLNEIIDKAFGV